MNNVVRCALRLFTKAWDPQHKGHQCRKQCNDNAALNPSDRQTKIYQHGNGLKTYYQHRSTARDDASFMQIKMGRGRKIFDYCSFAAFVSGYVFEQMSLLIAENNLGGAKHNTHSCEEYWGGIGAQW